MASLLPNSQCWAYMRDYAVLKACKLAKLKSSSSSLAGYFSDDSGDEEASYDYTTDNPEIERIMNIIGWEQAFTGHSTKPGMYVLRFAFVHARLLCLHY